MGECPIHEDDRDGSIDKPASNSIIDAINRAASNQKTADAATQNVVRERSKSTNSGLMSTNESTNWATSSKTSEPTSRTTSKVATTE